jgi:hypothetical protein
MYRYRGYIFGVVFGLIVQGIIFFGLFGLGASEHVVYGTESIWLCAAIVISMLIGEHFYPEEDDDRGD